MSKEKVGFDRFCGYRIPVGEKSDVVYTHDVICSKDSKPCRIPCPYDWPSGVKGSVVREDTGASETNLSLKEVKSRVQRLIDQWGPSVLETLIEGIDQSPQFYEWLCETFVSRYPDRAKKFLFVRERFEGMDSSLDEELQAKAIELCDEIHNAETEPCLTDVRAYSCVLDALSEKGVVTEEVQTTTLRFKKAPAPVESPEEKIKRCPVCGSESVRCPECGKRFPHGVIAHCDEPECQKMNAPLDCDCGRVVTEDLTGVQDPGTSFVPYEYRDQIRGTT